MHKFQPTHSQQASMNHYNKEDLKNSEGGERGPRSKTNHGVVQIRHNQQSWGSLELHRHYFPSVRGSDISDGAAKDPAL